MASGRVNLFEELTTALIRGLRWFNRSLLEILLRLGHVITIVAGEAVGVVAYSAALREGGGGRNDAANCLA
jgi:hypothetical protein